MTTVFVSRDLNRPNFIKIWDEQPQLNVQNGVFVGKSYLGISCLDKWPGPMIEPGNTAKMVVTFTIAE